MAREVISLAAPVQRFELGPEKVGRVDGPNDQAAAQLHVAVRVQSIRIPAVRKADPGERDLVRLARSRITGLGAGRRKNRNRRKPGPRRVPIRTPRSISTICRASRTWRRKSAAARSARRWSAICCDLGVGFSLCDIGNFSSDLQSGDRRASRQRTPEGTRTIRGREVEFEKEQDREDGAVRFAGTKPRSGQSHTGLLHRRGTGLSVPAAACRRAGSARCPAALDAMRLRPGAKCSSGAPAHCPNAAGEGPPSTTLPPARRKVVDGLPSQAMTLGHIAGVCRFHYPASGPQASGQNKCVVSDGGGVCSVVADLRPPRR